MPTSTWQHQDSKQWPQHLVCFSKNQSWAEGSQQKAASVGGEVEKEHQGWPNQKCQWLAAWSPKRNTSSGQGWLWKTNVFHQHTTGKQEPHDWSKWAKKFVREKKQIKGVTLKCQWGWPCQTDWAQDSNTRWRGRVSECFFSTHFWAKSFFANSDS